MRTSMALRLASALLLLPLTTAPQRAVGVVAHRHVEDHRDEAEEDARGHVLLHDRDEDREDHGGEGSAVERAAPGGLLVELGLAALGRRHARGRLARGLAPRRAPGAPRPLDVAGLSASVLTPALLLRLGHDLRRSVTPLRCCGSGRGGRAAL